MGQTSFDMRQQVLQKAYEPHKNAVKAKFREVVEEEPITVESIVAKAECKPTLAEELGVKPDIIDKGYVYLRSYIPSWVIALLIIIGAITFLLATPAKKTIKNLIKNWVNDLD